MFVPYELAVLAKQKGFDEDCLKFYYGDGWGLTSDSIFKTSSDSNPIDAPTYDQLQNWLRTKHKIYIELIIDGWQDDTNVSDEYIGYRALIWEIGKPKPHHNDDLGMSDYYTILQVALKDALNRIV